MHRAPALPRLLGLVTRLTLGLVLGISLTACGGGGGGAADNSAPAASAALLLQGTATVGAPLGNARIAVVDAKGVTLGSAQSHPTDGSYQITLGATPTLPLLVQAKGLDASGQWTVLHSLVNTLGSGSTVAHLTPLTQAVAALALGGDPASSFAAAADSPLAATPATQATAASDFLKTLIKTATGDLKIGTPETLNFQTDSGFATPNSLPDLLLEALRLRVEPRTDANGATQLTLSNKFLIVPGNEVAVNLATARTELLKGSAGLPANAIGTAAKATTTASSVLTNLALLDGMATTLNPLLAQAATATALGAATVLTGYGKHDGQTATELAARLADWGQRGLQISSFLVLGCDDETAKTGDCVRVRVGATLSDRSGNAVERWSDAATYNSSAKQWRLLGNGKSVGFEAQATSWQRLNAAGQVETGVTSPSTGVNLLLQGRNASNSADLISTGTVQTPLSYALPMAKCLPRRVLCIAASTGASSETATGGLADTLLQPGALGWLGTADGARAARYTAYYTAGTAEQRRAYLDTALVAHPAARHPVLDGIGSSSPLTVAAVEAGLTLNWSTWASANSDLRLHNVRVVVRYGSQFVERSVDTGLGTTSLTLAGTGGVLAGVAPTDTSLWLTAVDALGHRLVTRYALGV